MLDLDKQEEIVWTGKDYRGDCLVHQAEQGRWCNGCIILNKLPNRITKRWSIKSRLPETYSLLDQGGWLKLDLWGACIAPISSATRDSGSKVSGCEVYTGISGLIPDFLIRFGCIERLRPMLGKWNFDRLRFLESFLDQKLLVSSPCLDEPMSFVLDRISFATGKTGTSGWWKTIFIHPLQFMFEGINWLTSSSNCSS